MSYVRTVVDGNACYCVPIEHFEKLSNQVSIYYNALIAEQKNVEMLVGDLARANGLASERNKPERDVAPERKEGPDCRLCKNKANTLLIAAAPDLLSALIEAVELIEILSPIEGDTMRHARAAIAKAVGA